MDKKINPSWLSITRIAGDIRFGYFPDIDLKDGNVIFPPGKPVRTVKVVKKFKAKTKDQWTEFIKKCKDENIKKIRKLNFQDGVPISWEKEYEIKI